MKFFRFIILLAAFLPFHADAYFPHGYTPPSAVGNAQLNLGSGDLTAQLFTNLFNGANVSYQSGATPAALDQTGFPVQNFSGIITGQLGAAAQTLSTTGPWTMAWAAGRSCFRIIFVAAATVTNVTNATIVNGSGSGNLSVTGNCSSAGSITINWNNANGLTYQFDGTYTSWGSNTSGNFYLIRQSDQTAFNAGTLWTPEAVSFMKGLYPESLRPMAWNGYGGRLVFNWNYRKTTSNFSFVNSDYPPGTRCGGTTSFCTISVSNGALTSAAANDTPLSAWTGNEQIQGNVASSVSGLSATGVIACNPSNTPGCTTGNCQITVSSTTGIVVGNPILIEFIGGSTECNTQTTVQSVDSSTQFTIPVSFVHTYTSGGNVGYQTLTITGKTGGPKVIVNGLGNPIGSNFGDTLASGNDSFTYNSILDRVIYNSGGISNPIPVEAQVQLANLVNANYWFNFPLTASDTYVTSAANAIYSTLNSNLKAIFELDNENWNGTFPDTHLSTELGGALGITNPFSGAGSSSLAYQSLRIRQIFGNLFPTTNWASAGSRLERLYCFQAGGGGTGFITGPMQGTSLSSFGYNTSPNRPIDFIDTICYAPYVGGGSAFSGSSTDAGSPSPTSFDASLLNTIVSDWNASNTAGAISLIDQSIRGDVLNRVQTVTASGVTFTTPLAHNFSVNNIVRFTVSGGTPYSGFVSADPNLGSTYEVDTVPTSTTFTVKQIVDGAVSSELNAGSAGSGTMSVGFLTSANSLFANGTIFGVMSGAYTKYQNMTANDFSPAPAGGTPNVRWYEGALEPSAPTTAQCSNISINSTDCATLATALLGWKNDPSAAATIEYYYQTFKGSASGTITTGAMPNSKAPAQLVLQGGGLYGLNSNAAYCTSAFSTNCNSGNAAPYQLYNGFGTFSHP